MQPTSTLPDRPLADVLARATLAPSSHNTQPWRFVVRDLPAPAPGAAVVELRADRGRALAVNDPADRELTISCGCALFNLRVAAADAALDADVALLPDERDPDLLARVALRPTARPPHEAVLLEWLEARRTHRAPFEDRALAPGDLDVLLDAARAEGAWLAPVDDRARRAVAALIAEGDAAQWSDRAWRDELARWIHGRRDGDGLTYPAAPIARQFVRHLDRGGRVGEQDAALALASPVVAVLGTDGDRPLDWLRAGQALERVLLVGASHGVAASYLNQPVQVAALRPRLADALGLDGWPQLVLRLGYAAAELAPSPRRPLGDVVEHLAPER